MRTARTTPGAIAYRILARNLAGLPAEVPDTPGELAEASRASMEATSVAGQAAER
jgi:hypothetical protein